MFSSLFSQQRGIWLLSVLCLLRAGFVSCATEKVEIDRQQQQLVDAPALPSAAPLRSFSYDFFEAFVASLSVILVSEIGDKTFFIAAIMAMRNSRVSVFAGAMGALFLMTVLSTAVGYAATVISRVYTFYASVVMFVVFGVKMLKEGYEMSPTHGQEEMEEVNNELSKKIDSEPDVSLESGAATPGGSASHPSSAVHTPPRVLRAKVHALLSDILSPVFLQVFTLTFVAEWGDRSQISTIVLGAQKNPYAVALGGVLGHAACTGGAVLGGRLLAQQISVRTVTLLGGVTFLFFAALSLAHGP